MSGGSVISNNNLKKWVGDGSEGGTLQVVPQEAEATHSSSSISDINSTTINFASATLGTPFNIRLQDNYDVATNDNNNFTSTTTTTTSPILTYYTVKILSISNESSLAIGLVTPTNFQPGWKTKGYFYNGHNITNGSAALIVGFGGYGSSIHVGDVLGVYYGEVGDDNSSGWKRQKEVVFYHNGRCLGAGFSFDEGNYERLYPCLHLSGSATVSFSIPKSPPKVFQREQKPRKHEDRYSGDWLIEKAFLGPELGELPVATESRFRITLERVDGVLPSLKDGVRYYVNVKIDNTFRTSFMITSNMEAFDGIQLEGPCMSTRMMSRPDHAPMEEFVQTALSSEGRGVVKMIVSEQGQLIMSGPTVEMICSPFVETFEPVRSI